MKHVEVVCGIIINEENKIFVCKRGAKRALEGKWEFPGGKIEANETKEEALIREIKEELDSTVFPYEYMGKVSHEYLNIDKPFSIALYGYKCKLIKGNLELKEHTASIWLLKEDLKKIDFAEADIPFLEKL